MERENKENNNVHAHTRCVAPWFIVRWKDSKMTTSDKLLIIHLEERVGRGEELRMEDDL